jgi:hypothetical protein
VVDVVAASIVFVERMGGGCQYVWPQANVGSKEVRLLSYET